MNRKISVIHFARDRQQWAVFQPDELGDNTRYFDSMEEAQWWVDYGGDISRQHGPVVYWQEWNRVFLYGLPARRLSAPQKSRVDTRKNIPTVKGE